MRNSRGACSNMCLYKTIDVEVRIQDFSQPESPEGLAKFFRRKSNKPTGIAETGKQNGAEISKSLSFTSGTEALTGKGVTENDVVPVGSSLSEAREKRNDSREAFQGVTVWGRSLDARDIESVVDAEHHRDLKNECNEGYHLIGLCRVPGAMREYRPGYVTVTYMAVFMRPEHVTLSQRCTLKVAPCRINLNLATSFTVAPGGTTDDASEIATVLRHVAMRGGRVVAIKETGKDLGQGIAGETNAEVYFNLPLTVKTKYAYNVVNVPVSMTAIAGIEGTTVIMHSDIQQVFTHNLSLGWKLVDIFYDSKDFNNIVNAGTKNILWFFEKDSANLESDSAKYEGKIVEYEHEIHFTKKGTEAKMDMSKLLSDLGKDGWEFVCVLEKPEFKRYKPCTKQKIDVFFQRDISA